MKPTFGTVSRYGVVAMASSTDTIGCFAQTAADTDLVMGVMAGRDEYDPTTLEDFYSSNSDGVAVVKQGRSGSSSKPLKVAVIKDFMGEGVDPEVRRTTEDYLKRLEKLGAEVAEISMPLLRYALAVYYVVVPAEIASNLSRHDGIRYGFRAGDAKSLDEIYGKTRDQGFMPENKRRIMIGNFVLSSGFFDAYYLKAQKARTLLINAYNDAFSSYDLLVCPVAPTPAFKLGANTADPLKMYLEDAMTVPPSLAGLPALAVPGGKTKSGLPVGVQLIGPRRSDAMLVAIAEEVERV
jgi:aspartyl-tRNA(Asn)/glutamyl-tRNA(Gln) amidotransferase subunit A